MIASSGRAERTRASSSVPFPACPSTSNPERSSKLARPSRSSTSSSASTTPVPRRTCAAVPGIPDHAGIPRLSTTPAPGLPQDPPHTSHQAASRTQPAHHADLLPAVRLSASIARHRLSGITASARQPWTLAVIPAVPLAGRRLHRVAQHTMHGNSFRNLIRI